VCVLFVLMFAIAPAKSKETSEMCFFVFSDFVKRWSTKSGLSEVDFPFLKPNWFGCISLLLVKNHQSLCDIIFSNIFPMQQLREMGL